MKGRKGIIRRRLPRYDVARFPLKLGMGEKVSYCQREGSIHLYAVRVINLKFNLSEILTVMRSRTGWDLCEFTVKKKYIGQFPSGL